MSHLDRLVEGELYKFGIFIDCIESDKERLAKDGVHSCRSNRLKVEVVLLNLGQGLTKEGIFLKISTSLAVTRTRNAKCEY